MTTIYLIRHSIKERNYGEFDCEDTFQTRNEKIILSCQGERLAQKLSNLEELKFIDQVWCSNYVRAIQTAKYLCNENGLKLNISSSFDERHHGLINPEDDKEEFWIQQFIDKNLKYEKGESQNDVQRRMEEKIEELLENNKGKKIAIVAHNACILFYLLKYCRLEEAKVPKKLTIRYKDRILIRDSIMRAPSIMKLEFNDKELVDISYLEID